MSMHIQNARDSECESAGGMRAFAYLRMHTQFFLIGPRLQCDVEVGSQGYLAGVTWEVAGVMWEVGGVMWDVGGREARICG